MVTSTRQASTCSIFPPGTARSLRRSDWYDTVLVERSCTIWIRGPLGEGARGASDVRNARRGAGRGVGDAGTTGSVKVDTPMVPPCATCTVLVAGSGLGQLDGQSLEAMVTRSRCPFRNRYDTFCSVTRYRAATPGVMALVGATRQSPGVRGFTLDSRCAELIHPRVTSAERPSGNTSLSLMVKSVFVAVDVARKLISGIPVDSTSALSGSVVKVSDSPSSARWSGSTRYSSYCALNQVP